MDTCKFMSQFSDGKIGVRNNVWGMKSWPRITSKRWKKSLRNRSQRLKAFQESVVLGLKSSRKLWLFRRNTFIGIGYVFLGFKVIFICDSDRK